MKLFIMVSFASLVITALAGERVPEGCENAECKDPKHPIPRWDAEKKACMCESHPCGPDAQKQCTETHPVLDYSYKHEGGEPDCYCRVYCPQGLCAGERIHEKCAGAMCNDPEYPIVIYNEDTKDCQCAKHPCGVTKEACEDPKFPMLDYAYDRTGDIDCFCRAHPCPNTRCEPNETLQWNQEGKCNCIAHPVK